MATNNGVLYGVIGVMGAALVGGGVYLYSKERNAPPYAPPLQSAATPPAAITQPAPAPAPTAPAPVIVTPPAPAPTVIVPPANARAEQVRALVADARRHITRGDLVAADRALDQAERLAPNSPEVMAARHDLQDARVREARQDRREERRVDALVAQARAAIARRDYVAADRALDEAERIDGRDRDVQQARAELNTAQRPGDRGGDRDRNRDNGGIRR